METNVILVACALGLATAVNLITKIFHRPKISGIAKVTLMPLLTLLCYLINPQMNVLIFIGLGFGWLGDVFLLSTKKPFFLLGLSSFLTGHILYIVAIAELLTALNLLVALVIAMLLLAIGKIMFTSIRGYIERDMLIPVILYVLTLVSINFVSTNLLLQSVTLQSILLVVGTLLFMASDYILSRSIFIKQTKLNSFAVMALYTPAQVLIALAFALMTPAQVII